jgi:[glutamine synthetase] adenylyltransferase / [glutamine synthetase]-adenylyl-L-tyrosine phosphorylase
MMDVERNHSIAPTTDDQLYHAIGQLAADAGLPPPLFLKNLKSDVRSTAHPRRALNSFHRFLMTGFSSAWMRDFDTHRLLQQILLELCSQSQFLADILVRNPELFRWLTSSNVLKITKTRDDYVAEASDAVRLFQRSEKKLDSLKRFQRRELLRIGARQILKEADVSTTSGELSALADAITESVLGMAYDQMAETIQGTVKRDLAVIGLGKLGGEELNFSSDIDLVFVYDQDGPLEGSQLRLSTLHEYYCRVSEYVVRRLSEHTAEGHLYRVDMRLRPDGGSGPLAMSKAAYFAYYEARGELWERQMLMKARVIAGERLVGEGWMEEIRPFIFPKTLLSSPLEEIAKIKAKIESTLEDGTNIKLGSGGIRDIEFTVQALQLLNGGNNANLRQRNTLEALRQLAAAMHLKESEGRDLAEAYRFLRTVEDRLQLLHGLQKHSIPESLEERRILASQLGFRSVAAFSRKLEFHQARIRKAFGSVFGKKTGGQKDTGVAPGESQVDPKIIRKLGAQDARAAQSHIVGIMKEIPDLGDPGRLLRFVELLRKRKAPDWGVKNFLQLASAAPIKRTLQQAALNEKALDLLLLIAARSSRLIALLTREPLLFETLVGRPEDLLDEGPGWTFLQSSDLVRYRMYNEFKAVLRFLVGETTAVALTRELSALADEILAGTFHGITRELQHGGNVPIALLALGKLGGKEISVGSDLDLLLLYKEGSGGAVARSANALARNLREKLERVYEIDFRLRPEGKNSPLATEFEYYKQYFTQRASFWERQSLIKARFIAGDPTFGRQLMEHIAQTTYDLPLPKGWKKEIVSMRGRMTKERSKSLDGVDLKVGIGGLVDLEFLVQTIQMRHGHDTPGLRTGNTVEAIEAVRRQKLVSRSDTKRIEGNLEHFRRLEAFIRLNSEVSDFVLPKDRERLQAIVSAMGSSTLSAFRHNIEGMRKMNRNLFNKIIRSLPG